MDLCETRTIVLSGGEPGRVSETLEIPARIGNVRVGDVIGEGGSGVVLSGYDEAIRRRVAVKLLHRTHGALTDAAWTELAAGLRAAARVKHPNIVTIHSVENVNAAPAIIMEFVDGVSLRELIRRGGRMELPLALHLLRAIVSAVAVLHDADVVHRDLKPANILLDRDGVPHVCDFGLAFETHSGGIDHHAPAAGSPLYMAPEAFDGEISPASDVYALGIMLFELVTGSAPFAADSLREIRGLQCSTAPPLSRLSDAGVDSDVADIIERALHKQRYLRYKTAAHLGRALAALEPRGEPGVLLDSRLAAIVNAQSSRTLPLPTDRTPTHGHTTFDLIADRVRRKRESRR